MVAELIREAALEGVRDELPHSIAVVVEEMLPARGPPPTGRCSTSTPTSTSSGDSQKAIVIGPKGARLRDVGTRSRARRSRRCSARPSTSTCTSRSPRTGSATRASCASSASSSSLRG